MRMHGEETSLFLQNLVRGVLDELTLERVFAEELAVSGEALQINGESFRGPFYLAAIGKAAWEAAAALVPLLGDRLYGGMVQTRYGGSKGELPGCTIHEAGHPIPDQAGLNGTAAMLEEIRSLPEDITVIACISGGGSALFEQLPEGLELDDLVELNRVLLASGAAIDEINEIRKGVSLVKGGGLLDYIGPRRCLGLILSDVVGDDPAFVASGPTVPEQRGRRWEEIADLYDLWTKLPGAVLDALERSSQSGDAAPQGRVHNHVVLGGTDLCKRVVPRLEEAGYRTLFLSGCISGEAAEVGRFLGDVAREIEVSGSPLPRPAAVVTGGEAVVTIRGEGDGGPNMETALSFARQVRGMPEVCFLAMDTDGSDGGTDAAGGLVTGNTWQELIESGSPPWEDLKENNSLPALERADALLVTGLTGTNLNDLRVILMP